MRIVHASCGCDTGEVTVDVVPGGPAERAMDEPAVRAALAGPLAELGVGRDNVVSLILYAADERGEAKPWPNC